MGTLYTHPRSCDLPLCRITGRIWKIDRVMAAVSFPWSEPAVLEAVAHEIGWVYLCHSNFYGEWHCVVFLKNNYFVSYKAKGVLIMVCLPEIPRGDVGTGASPRI